MANSHGSAPTSGPVGRRLLRSCIGVAAFLLLAPAAALADTATSANWAGYAAHRGRLRFTRVSGAWKQPKATCSRGNPTYSAVWVGLGGFSVTSTALEQIGTEVDCTTSGRVSSTAWYELVPAASQPVSLRVRPGDSMFASVLVVGHRATLGLFDLTTHRSFQRTLDAPQIDVSSADWIVEAPSDCFNDNFCQTLPLANFGSAGFTQARAQAVGGRTGAVAAPSWDATKIRLLPSGRRFIGNNGGTLATATPSGLTAGGSSFRVTFGTVSVQSNPLLARRASTLLAGRLVHPTR